MKNILLAFLLFLSHCIVAQKTVIRTKTVLITQKKVKKSGLQFVLNKVIDDSRCPEGSQCIWAGEITIDLSVYKNNNLIEKKTMLLNIKNNEDNFKWFAKHLYVSKSKIKSIEVAPYPKEGVVLNPKDYVVKVAYSKRI